MSRKDEMSRGKSLTRVLPAVLSGMVMVLILSSCDSNTGGSSGRPLVVAAENFWGSLAEQLGGDRVQVRSIISNPNSDPHSYEPSSADARTIAQADMAIVNGVGYDNWAPRLLSASPSSGRVVLTVGDVVGARDGENPHRWYDPAEVPRVIAAISADLKRIDPKDASYFDRRRAIFETRGLARYRQLISAIRARYSGVPVGASESIFALQAPALGLDLITPPGYMKAISEGSDPTAQDKATVDRQIRTRRIKVWIFNSQNASPDIQRLSQEARAEGIPIVPVSETLTPGPGAGSEGAESGAEAGAKSGAEAGVETGATGSGSASFQDWQSRQLQGILRALARATGR
jgi:zinc/manganese transport system substrate-binding protein